jgi:GH15 family glucan-1,4-alpha-glucosidase
MSTTFQQASQTLLVNLNDEASITDLTWPIKGHNNIFLRSYQWEDIRINGTQFEKNYQVGYANLNELTPLYTQQYDEIDINITIETGGYYVTKNYSFQNNGDNPTEIIVYVIAQPDFGSNFSRDACAYYPRFKGMLHYEGDTYLYINANNTPQSYACHDPRDNSGRGAKPDKYGKLTENPVTNGRIETCLKYVLQVEPGESKELKLKLTLANSLAGLEEIMQHSYSNKPVSTKTAVEEKVNDLCQFLQLDDTAKEKLFILAKASEGIVNGSYNENGSIFAAVDSNYFKTDGVDDYSYFWPRDGALVTLARLRHNTGTEAELKQLQSFFQFCSRCLGDRSYMMHRFTLDKAALGSSWHNWLDDTNQFDAPLQLDQTALVVIAYAAFLERYGSINKEIHAKMPAVLKFIANSIDESNIHKACFDLWENHQGQFVSEQAAIIAALKAGKYILDFDEMNENVDLHGKITAKIPTMLTALENFFNKEDKYYHRGFTQETTPIDYEKNNIDASFHWLWYLGVLPATEERIKTTVAHAEKRLSILGGFARYENDHYLRVDASKTGNPWYITTLWFCQYYLLNNEKEKAKKCITFVLEHMDQTGLLPEMADPNTGIALSVKPLVWSHAEVLNLLNWRKLPQ